MVYRGISHCSLHFLGLRTSLNCKWLVGYSLVHVYDSKELSCTYFWALSVFSCTMNYGHMYPTKDDAFAADRKIIFSYFQFSLFLKKKRKKTYTHYHINLRNIKLHCTVNNVIKLQIEVAHHFLQGVFYLNIQYVYKHACCGIFSTLSHLEKLSLNKVEWQ